MTEREGGGRVRDAWVGREGERGDEVGGGVEIVLTSKRKRWRGCGWGRWVGGEDVSGKGGGVERRWVGERARWRCVVAD